MENKDLIIIALIILTFYLLYRQKQSKSLNIQPNSAEIQELKQQAQYYQNLYQKRVQKDLGLSASISQETQTEKLEILTNQDQEILAKVKEFRSLVEKTDDNSLDRQSMNEIETEVEKISHNQVKAIANQVITDSAYVLGHNNLIKKLEEKGTELDQVKHEFQAKLRAINVLFDEKAKSYERIDFSGLYSLLEKVKAERERERERERESKK